MALAIRHIIWQDHIVDRIQSKHGIEPEEVDDALLHADTEMKKKLLEFRTEEEEAAFWETHDATEYFDDSDRVEVDFGPAREAREQRPKGVILYRRKLRKMAG
jgi:hypothetical protein